MRAAPLAIACAPELMEPDGFMAAADAPWTEEEAAPEAPLPLRAASAASLSRHDLGTTRTPRSHCRPTPASFRRIGLAMRCSDPIAPEPTWIPRLR